jgi:hypothetical protein
MGLAGTGTVRQNRLKKIPHYSQKGAGQEDYGQGHRQGYLQGGPDT